ncbi:MAG: alpha/beta hydrolase [Meiothermus sp.]|uniref:alpha/beta hydrolase n=1 Tax=Meiothermus sp. TaxID=1955249 RepID=UPI0025FD2BF9|nr:alpha/beta hydrolase [Meiothermus sp.]MCS7059153.1 alpha/beta hydrolase [Meiothermus sp.]MCS7194871.1 alpha/beta hydrolase [Meiothermus sp.]MCX7741214.1 alpha/beta hydrolase [Meiothermus sp.]MDW8090403.1 alpha/beta hydrolase [Meiothermus sp.]MDW8481095.1 alpha/beta hydrolase [Meiothermus sp.]
MKLRKHHVFWLVFFGGLLLFAGAMVWYTRQALRPYPAAPEAREALASTPELEVRPTAYGWVFIPSQQVRAGLAFYPGGLVEPEAYAPVLRRIAQAGYRVALLRLRYNLAVTEQGKARQPIAEAPGLRWAVGGHSLGGVVASNFAASNPAAKALVMWAAYPLNDLSSLSLPTLALFGEKDGRISQEQLEAHKGKFPPATRFVVIPGLNHASFGAYGPQRGDNPTALPKETGWDQVAQQTVAFLNEALGTLP